MEFYYFFQSYFIYFLILFVLYYSCKNSIVKHKFSILVGGLLFYSLLFGLRYGVGTDCISYILSYIDVKKGFVDDHTEIGYNLLMQGFAWLDAPDWLFMGAVAFIQVFLVFLFFKNKLEITPYLALTFVLSCTWLTYGNGMRQSISFAFFVSSLIFLEKKEWIKVYSLLIISVLFHKSAIILLFIPLLYMFISKQIPSLKKQYVLFVCAFVLGKVAIITQMMNYIEQAAILFNYDIYLESRYSEKILQSDDSNGIGYFLLLLLDLFIIRCSKLLTSNRIFIFIYNLLFLGILWKYLFAGSPLMQRVNYYFYGFEYIVGAIILSILYAKKMMSVYYVLLCLYAFVLFGTLYRMFDNDSAFFFMWQSSDYLLLHK